MNRFGGAGALSLAVLLVTLLPAFPASAEGVDCKKKLLEAGYSPADQLHCVSLLAERGQLASALKTADLKRLISKVYERVMVKGDRDDAQTFRLLVAEEKRRDARDRVHDETVFGAFLAVGDVEAAEGAPYAKAPVIRRVSLAAPTDPKWSRMWEVKSSPTQLVEKAVDLTRGVHIVVYTSPGCGFCQAASQAIASEPSTRKIFLARSHWINIPDANYSEAFYASWSEAKYTFPTSVVFDRKGWPERRIPATPYFFFVRDGQVVGELIGWFDGSPAKLRAILHKTGIDDL